jgi:hypothetical protein
MTFAPPLYRVIEHVDRRILGAFQFVDAVTGFPLVLAAKVEVRSAALVNGGAPANVPLREGSVRLQQSRSGFQAIFRAPFFDDYAASFDGPQDPAETTPAGKRLRLRLALTDAGPHYLPQEFEFDVPRPVDSATPNNVFTPVAVQLFRAPGAPVLGGWSLLRVRVAEANTDTPLPGVLVRVFESPRDAVDSPIGEGMSEWRGDLRGEALVAVADLPRFRAGQGNNVFETTQAVHLEARLDTSFTGAAGQLPNLARILSADPVVEVRRSDGPADLTVAPAAPLDLQAGGEMTVRLTMP